MPVFSQPLKLFNPITIGLAIHLIACFFLPIPDTVSVETYVKADNVLPLAPETSDKEKVNTQQETVFK